MQNANAIISARSIAALGDGASLNHHRFRSERGMGQSRDSPLYDELNASELTVAVEADSPLIAVATASIAICTRALFNTCRISSPIGI
jgi:hypothetical protein